MLSGSSPACLGPQGMQQCSPSCSSLPGAADGAASSSRALGSGGRGDASGHEAVRGHSGHPRAGNAAHGAAGSSRADAAVAGRASWPEGHGPLAAGAEPPPTSLSCRGVAGCAVGSTSSTSRAVEACIASSEGHSSTRGPPAVTPAIAEGRVVGRVLRWSGNSGVLVYHLRENTRRKVHCSADAVGGRCLERGDVVEFTLREDLRGPSAEAVVVVVQISPPAPLALESAKWPSLRLEPAAMGESSVENLRCMRCLDDFRRTAEAPTRLRAAAGEYMGVIDRFRAEQEKRMDADLASNAAKGDADHAAACVACYREAWAFMKARQALPNVASLCEAHGILGQGVCKGAGHFRNRAVRVGQYRFIPHSEVPKAMERYVQGLEEVISREDLTPHAKAAWAGYHMLAVHPFLDGNGRLSRLLINWVLVHCGIPFPVVLCGSAEQRSAWHEALIAGHLGHGDSQPLAGIVAAAVARAWRELERAADREALTREEAAEDRAMRMARDRAKESVCTVCLDHKPNMLLVCCGAAFHLSCITRWLSTAPEPACPACRSPLPPLPVLEPAPARGPQSPPMGFMAAVVTLDPRASGSDLPLHLALASAPGLCAFCSNMRAADCSLRACARCCGANQRLYGVSCPRHVPDLRGAQWSDSTTSSDFGDESSVLSSRSSGASLLEDALDDGCDDRCAFCNNRRAAECALGACRSCCLNRPERCERHCPVMVPPQLQEPRGSLAWELEAGASFPPHNELLCAFCSNQRPAACTLRACRSCCLHRVGPCEWHATVAAARGRARAIEGQSTGTSQASAMGLSSDECRFCANQSAAGCSQQACRRCCIASLLPCDRHRR